ncbi:hypothetical protein GCM10009858_11400 [Terrabacter carboxydivorans]|uniref:Uncharacterized protein n=1 Tax=Terrabacter carboxydivorans TaxID=619730 RepID=A0ABN3L3K5_9MICO
MSATRASPAGAGVHAVSRDDGVNTGTTRIVAPGPECPVGTAAPRGTVFGRDERVSYAVRVRPRPGALVRVAG